MRAASLLLDRSCSPRGVFLRRATSPSHRHRQRRKWRQPLTTMRRTCKAFQFWLGLASSPRCLWLMTIGCSSNGSSPPYAEVVEDEDMEVDTSCPLQPLHKQSALTDPQQVHCVAGAHSHAAQGTAHCFARQVHVSRGQASRSGGGFPVGPKSVSQAQRRLGKLPETHGVAPVLAQVLSSLFSAVIAPERPACLHACIFHVHA